jgi:hypothetical protein
VKHRTLTLGDVASIYDAGRRKLITDQKTG